MEGRDLGKLKREGFFRGTKANVIRLQFVAGVMLLTFAVGTYKVYHGSAFMDYMLTAINNVEQNELHRRNKAEEIRAKRLEKIHRTSDRDDY